jgi:hypothetical protein
LLNLALVGIILVVQFRMLAGISLVGYAGMLALVASTILAGWLLGGPDGDRANRDSRIARRSAGYHKRRSNDQSGRAGHQLEQHG